ncbi:MAG TPA: hypothetical protein VGB73_15810 [Pyrinomonadaceae bacterium]|jgi:hypothetical protein
MIELKRTASSPNTPQLLIDGVECVERGIHLRQLQNTDPEKADFRLSVYDESLANKIAAHRFSDLPKQLKILTLSFNPPLLNPEEFYLYVIVTSTESDHFGVTLEIGFHSERWKHLWSIAEFIEEANHIARQEEELMLTPTEPTEIPPFDNGFALEVPPVSDLTLTIEGKVRSHSSSVNQLHELTQASLMAKLRSDAVVMHFDFPEEVRVPCEQYLLYFAQFLRDLGVRVDTALTHEAGQVLFTVTPADKEQALDKIRAALNAYLHLPSNPVSDAGSESIAVQRLESNILRLRSDLKLAAAELQAKNTTIEAQQLIIEVQKGLLSGEVIVNSMKDVTPKPKDKDKEELLGGTVSIIPLKGKGVEINLPELFRKLKRLFKDGE